MHSDNRATADSWKCCTHRSFNGSSVNLSQPTIFLIHSDHFRIHFYNIRQCQLTIIWVTMVIRSPIVLPKVLWVLHLQIIFDFNGLHMVPIFQSILTVINWYKTEVAQYFHMWCFFSIFITREKMGIEKGFCG